ncbi:uncharacterized protein JCM10292_006791 [Rhodotorula paludigena]|uniref:uncharacterized protein n=1 Tax=Rhodotorula paludigena TaxID=86838 RepID=UPI00317A73B7
MVTPAEGLVERWTAEQVRQASLARFDDDGDVGFAVTAAPTATLPTLHLNAPPVHRESLEDLASAGLHTVAGLDISFRSSAGDEGVAVLAVLSYPELKVITTLSRTVDLSSTPYVHSYLSFREAHFYVDLLGELSAKHPEIAKPQLLFVDGNGRWHPRQAGSAVAVGVKTGLPTVGIAKEYHPMHPPSSASNPNPASASPSTSLPSPHDFRTSQRGMRKACQAFLQQRGDWIGLTPPTVDSAAQTTEPAPAAAASSEYWGAALLSSPSRNAQNPIFVSPAHRLSLTSAIRLALLCTKEGKLPEPVRVADRVGREEARRIWPQG